MLDDELAKTEKPEQRIRAGEATEKEWNGLMTFLADFDVENAADDEVAMIWEARPRLNWTEGKIYLWGRDGWQNGQYHARIEVGDYAGDDMAVRDLWLYRPNNDLCQAATLSLREFALAMMHSQIANDPLSQEAKQQDKGF